MLLWRTLCVARGHNLALLEITAHVSWAHIFQVAQEHAPGCLGPLLRLPGSTFLSLPSHSSGCPGARFSVSGSTPLVAREHTRQVGREHILQVWKAFLRLSGSNPQVVQEPAIQVAREHAFVWSGTHFGLS